MAFANVSVKREQVTLLSQLLLTAFPGCVIHQSCDPMRTITHLSTQQVDAVFVDMDTHPQLMRLLNRQKSKVSVYLRCRHDSPPPADTDGIRKSGRLLNWTKLPEKEPRRTRHVRHPIVYPLSLRLLRISPQPVSSKTIL